MRDYFEYDLWLVDYEFICDRDVSHTCLVFMTGYDIGLIGSLNFTTIIPFYHFIQPMDKVFFSWNYIKKIVLFNNFQ